MAPTWGDRMDVGKVGPSSLQCFSVARRGVWMMDRGRYDEDTRCVHAAEFRCCVGWDSRRLPHGQSRFPRLRRRLYRAEILPTTPAENDILTVAEVGESLKCKPSSIYNLTRLRGRATCDNSIPVLRLPMGLRFRRSSVLACLKSQETRSAA